MVRALSEPRTRGVRVEYEGLEIEVEVTFEPRDEAAEPSSDGKAGVEESLATLVFSESGVTLEILDPEVTILAAGLNAGVDLLYSCTLGGCAACLVDVLDGTVEYEDPEGICLLDEELESGDVCLACVGRPRGRVVIDA